MRTTGSLSFPLIIYHTNQDHGGLLITDIAGCENARPSSNISFSLRNENVRRQPSVLLTRHIFDQRSYETLFTSWPAPVTVLSIQRFRGPGVPPVLAYRRRLRSKGIPLSISILSIICFFYRSSGLLVSTMIMFHSLKVTLVIVRNM